VSFKRPNSTALTNLFSCLFFSDDK